MLDFLTYIEDWLNSGVYTFFTEASAYAIKVSIKLYLQKMAMIIPFAWGIAKALLEDLGVSSHITSAWSYLPLSTRTILGFFNIPECINTILSGFVTKFVLRFIPGV